MDISSLIKGMLPEMVDNASTAANNTSTPHSMHTNIVESILPLIGLRGFAPVYRTIGNWLGWDPTTLLTVAGFIWASNKLFRQVFAVIVTLVDEYLMSTIHISSTDDIYDHLMAWLSQQPKMINSRALMAETVSKTAWEDEDESTVARDRSGLYLNFSNQEARTLPQYVPAIGLHNFWWKGQYFRLNRKRESIFNEGAPGNGLNAFKDKEDLMISCFSRSPDPIKKLLAHAKEHFYSDHQARTIVKRPFPLASRRGRNNWQQVANRPVRDMRTVVLDQQQKLQILADMNEYLHPATPRWYANRGIPLRRGYLFHGPPGTGKTSLSFALAGVFGLDIHVISLLEPTLTEEDLSSLFSSLPRRCVVLLEDIDTAGLRRPAEGFSSDTVTADRATRRGGRGGGPKRENAEGGGEVEGNGNSNSITAATTATAASSSSNDIKELAKALKKESEEQKKGISLSGLLNAIDGVASHEGRVLIMTTNVPESLDDALIRPGRVDLQVQFSYATGKQAEELFIRMYEGYPGRPIDNNNSSASSGKPTIPTIGNSTTVAVATTDELDITVDELPEIARQFGAKIPDGEFSPAEIQGYLLKRKKHPRRALEEADNWVEALVDQKANRTKISRVQ